MSVVVMSTVTRMISGSQIICGVFQKCSGGVTWCYRTETHFLQVNRFTSYLTFVFLFDWPVTPVASVQPIRRQILCLHYILLLELLHTYNHVYNIINLYRRLPDTPHSVSLSHWYCVLFQYLFNAILWCNSSCVLFTQQDVEKFTDIEKLYLYLQLPSSPSSVHEKRYVLHDISLNISALHFFCWLIAYTSHIYILILSLVHI